MRTCMDRISVFHMEAECNIGNKTGKDNALSAVKHWNFAN